MQTTKTHRNNANGLRPIPSFEECLKTHKNLVNKYVVEGINIERTSMKTQFMATSSNADGHSFWFTSNGDGEFKVFLLREQRLTKSEVNPPLSVTNIYKESQSPKKSIKIRIKRNVNPADKPITVIDSDEEIYSDSNKCVMEKEKESINPSAENGKTTNDYKESESPEKSVGISINVDININIDKSVDYVERKRIEVVPVVKAASRPPKTSNQKNMVTQSEEKTDKKKQPQKKMVKYRCKTTKK